MKLANVVERSRFAFDLGTNSIGWAVYRLDEQGRPCELVDCGVRLFSDGRNPKDGQSLAAMRRIPRAARRRRDRFIQRRDWLMTLLIRHGLMPQDDSADVRATVQNLLDGQNREQQALAAQAGIKRPPKAFGVEPVETALKALEKLDPYRLRGAGRSRRLEPFEIGRLLFQLNQRRGFKSNRVSDARSDDKEKGKIAAAGEALDAFLSKNGERRTLGEYFSDRQTGLARQRQGVRARINGTGAKAFYEAYPQREMLEYEFDAVWTAQAHYHPNLLTEVARDAIRTTIFHQRPLKAPVVGRCTFFPDEFRLSVAHPTAQAFRIFQELANIEITEGLERPRKLTLAERDLLSAPLLAGEDLTWGKFRKALDLGGAAKINLEDGGRDRLKGDEVMARLGGKKGRLKHVWPDLSDDLKGEVIDRLLFETETDDLTAWLI